MTTTHQKFVWNNEEASNQQTAGELISNTAEEHGIEVFLTGGEQFAERIEGRGLKYGDFTLHDFERWKQIVVDKVISVQIEAERIAFEQVLTEKFEKKKKKKSV